MTDIIERLRSIKTHGIDQRALKREAADEIEGLKAENKDLRGDIEMLKLRLEARRWT